MSNQFIIPNDWHLISNNPKLAEITLIDFLKFIKGDFTDNTTRGLLAEWLVACLLELEPSDKSKPDGGNKNKPRYVWNDWDLEFDGLKVEVKSSGYIQTWHKEKCELLKDPAKVCAYNSPTEPSAAKPDFKLSSPKFENLFRKSWNKDKEDFTPASYKADIYIFCLQINKCCQTYNALDLSQWRFYVLTRYDLSQRSYSAKSYPVALSEQWINQILNSTTPPTEYKSIAFNMVKTATTELTADELLPYIKKLAHLLKRHNNSEQIN